MENELIRICGLALVCAVGAFILRGLGAGGSNTGLGLRLAGAVAVFSAAAVAVGRVWSEMNAIMEISGNGALGKYALTVLKALGLAYISSVGADICRDCGESTVATGVETVGNIAILWLCVPIFGELLEFARELLSA